MKFYQNLYWGESIVAEKDRKRIRWKLKQNAGQLMIYLIVLAQNENQLEIFHCAYLKQKYFCKKNMLVVGIAKGYEEALAIVQKMAQDVLEETGDVKIKDYILKSKR